MIDYDIISLIIQEEKAKKKIEDSKEYSMPAVLYVEEYEEMPEETTEESNRGVIVIDI